MSVSTGKTSAQRCSFPGRSRPRSCLRPLPAECGSCLPSYTVCLSSSGPFLRPRLSHQLARKSEVTSQVSNEVALWIWLSCVYPFLLVFILRCFLSARDSSFSAKTGGPEEKFIARQPGCRNFQIDICEFLLWHLPHQKLIRFVPYRHRLLARCRRCNCFRLRPGRARQKRFPPGFQCGPSVRSARYWH